jgi:hypothetical protein
MDVQQILLQSTAVEKIQQAQQHPDLQQKYLAMQLSEQRKVLQARVNNPDEADSVHLREKEDHPQRRSPSKDRQEPGKEEETEGGPGEGQKIDIVV